MTERAHSPGRPHRTQPARTGRRGGAQRGGLNSQGCRGHGSPSSSGSACTPWCACDCRPSRETCEDRKMETMEAELAEILGGIGPRLRSLRRARGLTLEAVSADTGITVSTLSRVELGKRRRTLELLIPLARAYRVDLDQL